MIGWMEKSRNVQVYSRYWLSVYFGKQLQLGSKFVRKVRIPLEVGGSYKQYHIKLKYFNHRYTILYAWKNELLDHIFKCDTTLCPTILI